ncbi:unnamed protein product [Caenorhabditis angaria]|uniref:Uncharacterized protein n=1 Tax=Caenorhabditis angaria TaxID=860376 RepID=A0A9P1NCG1_9PELO|nr:unnamed protein product [Caenorhabditis angaria]
MDGANYGHRQSFPGNGGDKRESRILDGNEKKKNSKDIELSGRPRISQKTRRCEEFQYFQWLRICKHRKTTPTSTNSSFSKNIRRNNNTDREIKGLFWFNVWTTSRIVLDENELKGRKRTPRKWISKEIPMDGANYRHRQSLSEILGKMPAQLRIRAVNAETAKTRGQKAKAAPVNKVATRGIAKNAVAEATASRMRAKSVAPKSAETTSKKRKNVGEVNSEDVRNQRSSRARGKTPAPKAISSMPIIHRRILVGGIPGPEDYVLSSPEPVATSTGDQSEDTSTSALSTKKSAQGSSADESAQMPTESVNSNAVATSTTVSDVPMPVEGIPGSEADVSSPSGPVATSTGDQSSPDVPSSSLPVAIPSGDQSSPDVPSSSLPVAIPPGYQSIADIPSSGGPLAIPSGYESRADVPSSSGPFAMSSEDQSSPDVPSSSGPFAIPSGYQSIADDPSSSGPVAVPTGDQSTPDVPSSSGPFSIPSGDQSSPDVPSSSGPFSIRSEDQSIADDPSSSGPFAMSSEDQSSPDDSYLTGLLEIPPEDQSIADDPSWSGPLETHSFDSDPWFLEGPPPIPQNFVAFIPESLMSENQRLLSFANLKFLSLEDIVWLEMWMEYLVDIMKPDHYVLMMKVQSILVCPTLPVDIMTEILNIMFKKCLSHVDGDENVTPISLKIAHPKLPDGRVGWSNQPMCALNGQNVMKHLLAAQQLHPGFKFDEHLRVLIGIKLPLTHAPQVDDDNSETTPPPESAQESRSTFSM